MHTEDFSRALTTTFPQGKLYVAERAKNVVAAHRRFQLSTYNRLPDGKDDMTRCVVLCRCVLFHCRRAIDQRSTSNPHKQYARMCLFSLCHSVTRLVLSHTPCVRVCPLHVYHPAICLSSSHAVGTFVQKGLHARTHMLFPCSMHACHLPQLTQCCADMIVTCLCKGKLETQTPDQKSLFIFLVEANHISLRRSTFYCRRMIAMRTHTWSPRTQTCICKDNAQPL